MSILTSAYRRTAIYLVITLFSLLAIALVGGSALGLWVPDYLRTPDWIFLGKVDLPNSDTLHVLQWPDTTFYLTFILWEGGDGSRRCYMVGEDDNRIWRWWATIYRSDQLATLTLSRDQVFMWDIAKRELRGTGQRSPYPPFEDDGSFAPIPAEFSEEGLTYPRVTSKP